MPPATAADLVASGARPQLASDRLRATLMTRLREGRDAGKERTDTLASLYPSLVLEEPVLQQLTAALLSGSHVLLLGPSGCGKTSLAKAVADLMPRDIVAVKGCPVQDDPWSLLDPAFAALVPACPVCRMRHGEAPKPDDVPIETVRVREGHGLARVQGSPEVFPDNLTGTINLARLEEVGDPTSPLVLEPGKLLQAHRGVLLVDEVGKLPRGTQNVLLQALQERIVTPAKSRETFPADVVAIATSNLPDLGNISEPLTDRLANVIVSFPASAADNRRIVDLALGITDVPGPYRDAAVHIMQRWRDHVGNDADLGEVGSNRALMDIVRRGRSHAALLGDRTMEPEDLRRGAMDAMTGRIRARSADGFEENRARVAAFVEQHWKDAARAGATAYWCRFFEGELNADKKAGARLVQALREHADDDAETLRGLLRQEGNADLRRFAQFVQAEEGIGREEVPARLPVVFRALEGLGAFEA